ncbi:putative toxin-antitoxin system toxin component, PIN family [candidate division KSB1 bacterium]|nr:putative toxin-antitoxin system toxin component, PIN family [candidate division KSB1 bacterium]NIV68568.1 putative toxin-antitoxin system toxin component, PIN family [Phycisphaerae bacterium]NIR69124.1 putative toxin-antitoxin system toxin component, PIN family [candidate division KSB1 bacterium]NIS22655.1 putative toxin-antitoxin system toxin component, PIN family [candidate division KSB1 bacterium]NIT69513.1 putative toxin-antitoxin system toxin component, PIN family [candidate division KS
MKIIVDTNVFVSGVSFTGPPYEILKACQDGKVTLVISPEIFEEYHRVGQALGKKFPGIEIDPILDLIMVEADLVRVPELSKRIFK